MEMTKERVHELEEKSVEIIQFEKIKNKDHKFKERFKSVGNIQKSNIVVIRAQKRGERIDQKKYLKKID